MTMYLEQFLERVKEYDIDIQKLLEREQDFKSIYEDLEAAQKALQHFEKDKAVRKVEIADYKALIAELENEIIAYLDRQSS